VVATALDAVGADPVAVVGHSAGRTDDPPRCRSPAVRRVIYLYALVAMPGSSFAEQLDLEPDTLLPEYLSGLQRRAGVEMC
jgi:hypothetical protein